MIELGIGDVGLYDPLDPAPLPLFERISADILPALRAANQGA